MASLAPTSPALAQPSIPAAAGPGLLARLATGIGELFAEPPRGEMRAGTGAAALPGRTGTAPQRQKPKPPGKRIKELTGQRFAHGSVYELEDGRRQVELSSVPRHYRDADGKWQPIDTAVGAASGDGFTHGNDRTGFSSRFGDDTAKLMRVAAGKRQLTLGVSGDSRRIAPEVKGSTVTYRGVWDGADLVYKLTSQGVKEYIVLSKPPAAGAEFAFIVKTGGVEPQARPDGSIAFTPKGEDAPAFTIPKPFMVDSAADPASPYGRRFSAAVTQTLGGQGAEATITLKPDAAWLAAPDRKWPVVIDPTINLGDAWPSRTTYVDSASPKANFDSSWKLPVGKTANGVNRALLYFNWLDWDVLPLGARIDQATLETYFDQALGTAGPVTVEAHEITSEWDSSTAAWNNQPAFSPTVAASVTKNAGELSRWHSFDITALANAWSSSPDYALGVLLKAADESSTAKIGGPVYESSEDLYGGDGMTGETATMPKLTLTFGIPSVRLKQPETATSVGASLSWTPYADPTPGDASDDLAEYRLYRRCSSGCQEGQGTSGQDPQLVTTLPTDATSYVDTSSGAEPDAATDPSYVHEVNYWVEAVLKNGQTSASQEMRVILPRPGQVTRVLVADADTTIASGEATAGHDTVGGLKRLQVGNTTTTPGTTRALVGFGDFTNQIPADAQISEATLSLWAATSTGSGAAFSAHRLTRGFDENATWAKADATTSWNTAGGDFDAAVLGSVGAVSAQPRWQQWTVTDAAKAWIADPSSNRGLLVKVANEAGTAKQSAQFLASETDEPLLRPRLRVTYADKTDGASAFYAPGTPERLDTGATRQITVAVTNTTTETWKAASTALSYHWKLPDGTDVSTADNQLRTQLPADLAPGESTAVYATVKAPALTGAGGNKAEAVSLVWDVQDTITNNWKSATHHLPELPQQIRLDSPTSDLLGSEKFYTYTGKNTGAGSTALVNPYAGNLVWNYNAFSNPSRGPQTFVRMTYNSLDTSASSMGYGWSLQTSTLQRLGSQVSFHPPGQKWPSQVRMTDGDGTTHVWTLPEGTDPKTCTPSTCAYRNPRGVHLYLQQTGSADPLRKWVFTKPDRTQFFYDDEGFQSAIVDKNGNTMSFTYERRKSNNKPTKFLQHITDATGRRTLTLTYYAKGQDYAYIDDAGKEVKATKLTNPHIIDNVESITDIAGRKVTFTYTDKGLMAKMVDGAGDEQAKTFGFTYDATQGNKNVKLVSVQDPRGHSTDVTYYEAPVDPKDKWKAEKLIDRLDGVTKFDYVDPDGPQGGKIHATVTDPLQHATKYVLDAYGRAESITNAKNETTGLQWDPDHNVTDLTEPNQARWSWKYDPKTGYPLEIRDAEANDKGTDPTVLTYQTFLNGYVADLKEKTSPEKRKWAFGYDSKGNLKTVTDPLGVASAADGDYTTSYEYDGFGQLTRSIDANDNPTSYGDYHPSGYPEKITDAYGKNTVTSYDVRGNVLSVTDALGKKTTQTYDVFKRPLENTVPKDQDASPPVLIVTPAPEYDRNDNIVKMTAPNGAVSTALYDDADQLLESLLPKDTADGPERKASFTYDAAGNLKTQTEPKGNLTPEAGDFVTTYTYDPIYQLTDVLNAQQQKITYVYDNVGNTTTVIDPRKNATADTGDYTAFYTYDRNHRVTRVKDAAGHETGAEYDLDGLVTSQTDQEGNKTFIDLNGRGEVAQTRVPHSQTDGTIKYTVTRFVYDEVGNRTKVITPRGVETTDDDTDFIAETRYDKLNRPAEKIYPFDKDDPKYNTPDSVKYVYDEVSQLKEISAPPSHGQTIRNVTKMTYWDNGWSKTTTDPWDIKTTYDYNTLGLQTNRTVTSAGGSSQRAMDWSYYPDGKLRTHSDDGAPLGLDVVLDDNSDVGQVSTTGSWTTVGTAGGTGLAATVEPGTGFTGYDYAIAPAGTGQSTFTWNLTTPSAGTYKVHVRYPTGATATNAKYTIKYNGGETTATVDQTARAGEWVSLGEFTFAEGNAHSITLTDEANGTVAADAVKLVRDAGGQTDTEKKDFGYTYDANANLTLITDSSPTAKIDVWDIAYTGLNQIDTIKEKLDSVVKNTTTYRYNENGAVTERTHDKTLATYRYDVRDLVDQVVNKKSATDTAPKTTGYTYTPKAERLTEAKANGNTVTYDYFLDGLLRHSIEKKSNGTVVSEHTIGYQGNLQRSRDLTKLQNADSPGAYLENEYTYTYDPRDRIAKSVKTPVGGGTATTDTYTHDPNSNVYDQTVLGKQTTFTFDRNRLMTSTTAGATSTYTYDPYGRLRTITGGGKVQEKYTYDGFDHVTRHEKLGGDGATSTVTTYTYDPLDRTTSKTEKEGTDKAKTTAYSYLGLSGEVLDEEVAGKLVRSFQYSPWGERLSQVKTTAAGGEESSYYGYNAHTDVEDITGESGDTRATYGYTAYGSNDDALFTGVDKPDPANPTAKDEYNPYRFNAKRWDNSTGMYDMGFRDYNPGLNRFLTLDSYNGALDDLGLGLDPWTANRYAFTGGNPITGIELDGHMLDGGSQCGYYSNNPCTGSPRKLWYSDKMNAPEDTPAFKETANRLPQGARDQFAKEWSSQYGSHINSRLDTDGADLNAEEWNLAGKICHTIDACWGDANTRQFLGSNYLGLLHTGEAAGAPEGPASRFMELSKMLGVNRGTNAAPCNSFVPGTDILMADGTRKPIEEVEVGDEVLATDPETGKTEAKPVIALITGEGDKNLVQITVDTDGRKDDKSGLVIATDKHPFWVPALRKWVDATDLKPGMWLRTSAGTRVQVTAIKKWTTHQRVHNLTIADIHTYYVLAGKTPVLVHNSNCPGIGRELIGGQEQFHIIHGDRTGGGHKWPGQPGKTVFPRGWDTDKILDSIVDVATSPNSVRTQQTGRAGALYTRNGDPSRWKVEGVVDGVNIRVIYEPATNRIVTGFPYRP
ncbi:DNRLRE domain-containing protein [Streptosporangium sandarakinum]|uniref:DNRLRE domain-containing protein n=1 Tax=Streptosporangium sandarakinum TaxID=1260955 RepID=UPI0036B7EC27